MSCQTRILVPTWTICDTTRARKNARSSVLPKLPNTINYTKKNYSVGQFEYQNSSR